MKPEHSNREEIFNEALRLSAPADREAYLNQACAGNEELRRDLESLLAAHTDAGNFLGHTCHSPSPERSSEHSGMVIGRYKLLEKIGEGGFGDVWMAEQQEPVRRRVALKIIKLGMDTREVVARFEAERQALALMEHPNIARVFDGGATETGRPYFVMELVKGVPLTQYCDANRLSTRARLELFTQVCHAVQHAHQKGIIHRDLKPSNILVTVQDDRPVPKVIDFGVAKATQAKLTEKTLFTRFHEWIGTPAYMSPEQAGLSSLDVDTRSDIYSLGVLLYELLTGRTPFDTEKLMAVGYDAVMRTIREEEPPKPSTRISTMAAAELAAVAAKRGADPGRLNRLVRGDLDWVVMKCLEKDRKARYETAESLAQDLERHFRSEPVLAAAPSVTYRALKFAQRYRFGLATAGALAAVILAGALVSRSQAVRAVRNAEEAERQRQKAIKATEEAGRLYQESERARRDVEQTLYRNRIQLAYRDWLNGDLKAARQQIDACPPALRHWEWAHLQRLCQPEQISFSPPLPENSRVSDEGLENRVVFRQDTGLAWTACGRIWSADLSSGQFRPTERSLDRTFRGLASSTRFLSSEDGTNRSLLDLSSGRTVLDVKGPWAQLVLSSDNRIAAASDGTNLTIYPLQTPDRARVLPLPPSVHGYQAYLALNSSSAVAFMPAAGRLLAWSIPDGKLVQDISELERGCSCLAITLDAKGEMAALALRSASAPNSPLVVPVDLAEGKALPAMYLTREAEHSTHEVTGFILHPSQPWVLVSTFSDSASDDHTFVFDWRHGRLLQSSPGDLGKLGLNRFLLIPGESGSVPIGPLFGACCMQLAPDGSLLAIAGFDGIIRVWSMETGRIVATHRGHEAPVICVAFDKDGRRLASIDRDGTVKVWGAAEEPCARNVRADYGSFTRPADAMISDDGNVIITPDLAWHLRDGFILNLSEKPEPESLSPNGDFFIVEAAGYGLVDSRTGELINRLPSSLGRGVQFRFDEAGRRLAVFSMSQARVEVWDIPSAKLLFEGDGPGPRNIVTPGVQRLAMSRDGKRVAASFFNEARQSSQVLVWDVAERRQLLSTPSQSLNVSLRPDGNVLAVSQDGRFEAIDVASGERHRVPLPDKFQGDRITWSPDQTKALCLAADRIQGELYDVRTGAWQHLAQLVVGQPVWSKDGRRIAGTDQHARISLWDGNTGAALLTLDREAEFVAFAEGDQWLAAISPPGILRVLNGSPIAAAAPQPPAPARHERSVRTEMPGLTLISYLRPANPRDTFNNSIPNCVMQSNYLYALSREGTLWTFPLPTVATQAEVVVQSPVSEVQLQARGEDLLALSNTLLCASSKSLEVYSLDDPAHPRFLRLALPDLGLAGGQLAVAGNRLLHFGTRYRENENPGFVAVLDVTNPREPALMNLTPLPAGVGPGCIADNLFVCQFRRKLDNAHYSYPISIFELKEEGKVAPVFEMPCDTALFWFLPTGPSEMLALADNSIQTLRIDASGKARFLPDKITAGSRCAVLSRDGGRERLIVNGAVLVREGGTWKSTGRLPVVRQADGRPHRACQQGSYLAIPEDDCVWLYLWH